MSTLERETLDLLAPAKNYLDELQDLGKVEISVKRELQREMRRESKKRVFRFRKLEHADISSMRRK